MTSLPDRPRVLVPEAASDDDLAIERELWGDRLLIDLHRARRASEVPDAAWAAADACYVAHLIPFDAALIAKLERCRLIVRTGVGFDHIDLQAAGAAGIAVCNVPDYGTSEVADHAIGLMLALVRGITRYHDALREDPIGGFDWRLAPNVRRIRGATFGVVGLGRIGSAAALRAKAFGMRVVAFDPHVPRGQEIALDVERVDRLEDLLAVADVVSLHCYLDATTRHLIDGAALARMQPHALLINTARGGVVDLEALHDALAGGRIGGAGIDVLAEEPPVSLPRLVRAYRDREPWCEGRLILTPHAAFASADGRRDMRVKGAKAVLDGLFEGWTPTCVNAHLLRPRGD